MAVPAIAVRYGSRVVWRVAVILGPPAILFLLFLFLAAGSQGTPPPCGSSASAEGVTFDGTGKNRLGIPPKFYVLYHQAADRFRIDWTVLAAVGYIESTHGENPGTSSMGARGPMQFMHDTWQEHKTASGDPPYDIMDPKDSIHAAAHKIAGDAGPKRDYSAALFAYNHSAVYVADVMAKAREYGYPSGDVASEDENSVERQAGAPQAHVFPLPRGSYKPYANSWGDSRPQNGGANFHEGVDIEAAQGTPVLSPTDGALDAAGWNRLGGWRVGITDSRGIYFYLAHLRYDPRRTLRVGDRVHAGEKIGEVGHTGEGPPGTLGGFPAHLHFGMYDRGDVLSDGSRRASGAVNPYPYLRRFERGGALAEGQDQEGAPCMPRQEGDAVTTGDADPEQLLQSKRVELAPQARSDLKADVVDERLVRLLVALTKDHTFAISVFKSGHSRCVGGGSSCSRPSNHFYGRATDVWKVDGKTCISNPTASSPCGRLGKEAVSVRGRDHPTEVIFAVDLDGAGSSAFADAGHADHVHIGYDTD